MSDKVLSQFKPETHEENTIDCSRRLKFGIIGTGWIAESHVEALKQMPDVDIVAGADLIPGKAEAFFKRYGVENVRLYPSHKEMLEAETDLDAVCVCTYNKTHAECTIDALNKGLHVLLEKPMCVTTQEALDIVRAEKKSGKILSLGFQPRMDENMKMIKKVVDSGELGRIYYIQTGGGRRHGIPGSTFIEEKTAGIGALGDIGCYSLDMVLNAIGYPKPLTVSGYRSNYLGTDPEFNTPEDNYRRFRELWMTMCANISQSGLPVVLCGCGIPEQFEVCEARKYFTDLHYLALVCDTEALETRMRKGRGIADEGWIQSSVSFNEWLKKNAQNTSPAITLINTTNLTPEETAGKAEEWITGILANE